MLLLNPLEDGKTHINVYSKGKTELGRLLSNFAHTPFELDGKTFQSVEAYWYWILTKSDSLCDLYGFAAKKRGRELTRKEDGVTPAQLKRAYLAKVEATPILRDMLLANTLPLVHYYVHNGRVKYEYRFAWTALLWNEVKQDLISGK